MDWSQLETLSGFLTYQSSSGTGQSAGSAAPRGWSFLPLRDQPQYAFPMLGRYLKGDSSTSPDKTSHRAHKARGKGTEN